MSALLIGLIFLGIGLIAIEVFVVGGILGAIGTGVLAYVCWVVSQNYGANYTILAIIGLSLTVLVVLWLEIKWFKKTNWGKKYFCRAKISTTSSPEYHKASLINSAGVTVTKLNPSGQVMLKDKIYEAKSQGGLISKGEKVSVVKVTPFYLLVTRK